MKRTIFFSLFLLVFVLVGVMGITNAAVPIRTPGLGGGGNPGYFKYTEQINLTQPTTETTFTSYPGEDLDSLSWLCPGYVSGTELQILSATEYTQNNASLSISSSATAVNVTFTNGGDGGADSKYGGIGYGGYIPATIVALKLSASPLINVSKDESDEIVTHVGS